MAQKRKLTEKELADRALLSVLKDWPLEPGQMLLMGPKSVKALTTRGGYDGKLPDTYTLDRSEWAV